MGTTSAPYSQVVLLIIPTGLCQFSTLYFHTRKWLLTVSHAEDVDSSDGESFPDGVVGAVELSEHDCRVDFPETDTSETSDQHFATSPCVGEENCRQRVGDEPNSTICTSQAEHNLWVEAQAFVQDRLVVLKIRLAFSTALFYSEVSLHRRRLFRLEKSLSGQRLT